MKNISAYYGILFPISTCWVNLNTTFLKRSCKHKIEMDLDLLATDLGFEIDTLSTHGEIYC